MEEHDMDFIASRDMKGLQDRVNHNFSFLRSLNKMTMRQLSERTGISPSTISRIENKKLELLPLHVFVRISNHFGIDVCDLLTKDLRLERILPLT